MNQELVKLSVNMGSEIALASTHRIIKKFGAERVSDSAADELRKILELLGENISRQAVELAFHAHRKTIKPEDIILASKNFIK
ncbi:MAG TPA: histone family protein [Candidatus Nitrosocosmicus sp.]|nr:histone family protein [Candidatus Nitrosocosmicus sp.]